MKSNSLQFRLATIEDIELLTEYRMKLWRDAGKFSSKEEDNDIYHKNFTYFKEHFHNNIIVAPLFLDGNSIASIGIGVIIEKPVVNWENMGLEGYIFNMYTEEMFRKRGLATRILNEVLSFFKSRGVFKVSLNSNKDSFNLYKRIGMERDPYFQEIKLI